MAQIHPDYLHTGHVKMIVAELNYPVHEQEFLALFSFIKRHRMFIHGIDFTACVDHKEMEYLQTQSNLSQTSSLDPVFTRIHA